MYSPAIVERTLSAARKAGLKFVRRSREDCLDIRSKLERLRYDSTGKLLPEGVLARPLNEKEQLHIASEQILCKADFSYYFTRYNFIDLDPGVGDATGIGAPILLESQTRYITLFGRREEECHAEYKQNRFTTGIRAYIHKVRQVAATATVRGMTMHRMLFYPGSRAFAASLDDVRVSQLFARDKLTLDNLPFWLKPGRVFPDVKDTELGFAHPISSHCAYQAENQQQGRGGLGVGLQRDISHLTEVGLWVNPGFIRFSFAPAIPNSLLTLHVQESTANGKGGYWHEVTEDARHRRRGYEHWIYAFIPWYLNHMKYRMYPPSTWVPEEHTLKHAELIERSSPEFCDGKTYSPSREQLYWWETTRVQHARNGELATFLTNFPATPEQSFQHPNQGALPVELLEEMELGVRGGRPYEVEVAA